MAKEKSIVLKWQGTAGIEQAHSLSKALLEAIENNDDVRLDISEVEDIDITGIQIIIAAKNEAENKKKKFFITGKVPPVIEEFSIASSISLKGYTETGASNA